MLKTLKVVKRIETEEVLDVICNKCGESCYNIPQDPYSYEGIQVSKTGGYYSKHLGDMNEYKFDLCEKCLWELMKTFKHNSLVLDVEEEKERVVEDYY
jgi:hypothetical protein